MSGVAGRSGRKAIVTTPEQRNNVKVMVGLGIPQDKICLLVINQKTGKPVDAKTLRKHFAREIATGATELHARMGNFIVANIFGIAPPTGTVAIDNQHVRGSLAIFFAKTRMGWRETVVNRHEPVDGQTEKPNGKDVRQKILAKLDRLARRPKTGNTGGSSEG
jgi:hypothetical protein